VLSCVNLAAGPIHPPPAPHGDGERINLFRALAIGERVGNAGPDLLRSPMKRSSLMRDFRDAKVIARALRHALKARAIETTHA